MVADVKNPVMGTRVVPPQNYLGQVVIAHLEMRETVPGSVSDKAFVLQLNRVCALMFSIYSINLTSDF